MSERGTYLVIGNLISNHNGFGENAMAIARALIETGAVIFVHDDLSLPPRCNEAITFLRAKDLENNFETYANHKRVYYLDNHYGSLFALKLLRKYPGAVITLLGSYHDLIINLFQSEKDWPNNYATWIADALEANGRVVAKTLLQHRRLSNAVGAEVHDRTPLGLDAHPNIILAHDQLFPFADDVSAQSTETKSTVLCCGIDQEVLAAINQDFENLGAATRLVTLEAHTEGARAAISNASIVVLSANDSPSALLSTCMKSGKAIIVAGYTWNEVLADDCCLRIDNPAARHQLVAAIAAISQNTELKIKLQKAAQNAWVKHTAAITLDTIKKLTQNQPAIALPATQERVSVSIATNSKAIQIPKPLLQSGADVPTALIGSVPAPQMLAILLPGIDADCCPRFATPELTVALTEKLSDHGPEDANSLLAHLGFETPIIRTKAVDSDKDADLQHINDWQTIKQGLRCPDSAVTINASVDGLPELSLIDWQKLSGRYATEIMFADSLKQYTSKKAIPLFDDVRGYIENAGLFWKLDKVQRAVHCIMIVGVQGAYTLSAQEADQSATYIVADDNNTQSITSTGIRINADINGIISFTVCAVRGKADQRFDNMDLLKSLAETPLKLEWSSYD